LIGVCGVWGVIGVSQPPGAEGQASTADGQTLVWQMTTAEFTGHSCVI
jgi:hypothetical protein